MMKLSLKMLVIVLYITGLCACSNDKAKTFVQPAVLEKNAAFNLAQLSFKENVTELISKSLDSGDLDVKGLGLEAFKSIDSISPVRKDEGYILLGEKRYFFETLKLDSIARFDSLFFYKAGLETDKDKHLVAVTADAKFKDKKELDKFLSRLFKKLGKTKEELAIKADDQKIVDEAKARGLTEKEIDFMGYREGSKYDLLDYPDDAYFEWKLKDRYIQVSLSKGREIGVSTDKGNYNIEYLYLKFLVIKKEEYEKIEKLQYDNALKLKHQCKVLKPYEIYSLDPLINQRFFLELNKAWGVK